MGHPLLTIAQIRSEPVRTCLGRGEPAFHIRRRGGVVGGTGVAPINSVLGSVLFFFSFPFPEWGAASFQLFVCALVLPLHIWHLRRTGSVRVGACWLARCLRDLYGRVRLQGIVFIRVYVNGTRHSSR